MNTIVYSDKSFRKHQQPISMHIQKNNNGNSSGTVYFIGAGPGDPELVTVKGARTLAEAEVIITDRLASNAIIQQYVNKDAIIVETVKEDSNKNSYTQQNINQLLLQFSNLYEKTVRLKGGDTGIFSNIFDELKTLQENNIRYEIIPGITAAAGASAYTGVPLTARGYASGVQFLTYYKNTIVSDENWNRLAAFENTLVFYMSSNNLLSLVKNLLHAGAQSNIPFIVVEHATTPQQRVHSFSLDSFLHNPVQNFASPSIVIMGHVAELYKNFSWFEGTTETALKYFRSVEDKTAYLKIHSFITQKNIANAD